MAVPCPRLDRRPRAHDPEPQSPRAPRKIGLWCLALFAVNFTVKFTVELLYAPFVPRSHDETDYLLLAENLAAGRGFVSDTWWSICVPQETIPYPEFHRAPLLPLLLSLCFRLFGPSYRVAAALNIAVGCALPVLTLLLALALGCCRRAAILAGLLTSVSWALGNYHFYVLTEALNAATILLVLVSFYQARRVGHYGLVGLFLGWAFLTRSQALWLVPVVLLGTWMREGGRAALPRGGLLLLAMGLVLTPWMMRNVRLGHGPFYMELKYSLISTYEGDDERYFHSVERAPEPLHYILTHPGQAIHHATTGLIDLIRATPRQVCGNELLFLLALGGVFVVRRDWRRYLTLYLFIGMSYLLLAVSMHDTRYLYAVTPLCLLFAAVGLDALWSQGQTLGTDHGSRITDHGSRRLAQGTLGVAVSLEIFLFVTQVAQPLAAARANIAASEFAGPAAAVAQQLGSYFAARVAPDEVIMAGLKPYFIAYHAKRRSMSFPICDGARLERFLKDYRVRYILLTNEELERFQVDGWMDGLDALLRQGRVRPVPLPADVPAVAYEVLAQQGETNPLPL